MISGLLCPTRDKSALLTGKPKAGPPGTWRSNQKKSYEMSRNLSEKVVGTGNKPYRYIYG